jgi:hypothetical protein
MHASLLLLLTLAWPQDTDEARRAIAVIRKAEGTIGYDEKLPGNPVVSVNL